MQRGPFLDRLSVDATGFYGREDFNLLFPESELSVYRNIQTAAAHELDCG
jgi:hypothetical protein